MDSTLTKFGYPDSLVAKFENWMVLLRPQQVTLGALVLIEINEKNRFSDLSAESMAEMGRVVQRIETVLLDLFAYDKINYLMLMMVDPEVHFHVIPRYERNVTFKGMTYADPGWPAMPRMDHVHTVPEVITDELMTCLRASLA